MFCSFTIVIDRNSSCGPRKLEDAESTNSHRYMNLLLLSHTMRGQGSAMVIMLLRDSTESCGVFFSRE